MLGIIDILCRGVLHFLLLEFLLYFVWDLPMFLRLQLVSFGSLTSREAQGIIDLVLGTTVN